jgi:hypothetical protein
MNQVKVKIYSAQFISYGLFALRSRSLLHFVSQLRGYNPGAAFTVEKT